MDEFPVGYIHKIWCFWGQIFGKVWMSWEENFFILFLGRNWKVISD